MKLLFVNACPRGEASRTLALARTFLDTVTALCPDAEIMEQDLSRMGLSPVDARQLALREAACDAMDWSAPLAAHAVPFQQADALVIAAPYWDLSFPACLKVWVEHMWVRNLTFRYEDDRPVGLCRGRECLYVTTSGSPIGENDWGAMYIKAVTTTLGIPVFTTLRAEALDLEWTDTAQVMTDAMAQARLAAAAFVRRMQV